MQGSRLVVNLAHWKRVVGHLVVQLHKDGEEMKLVLIRASTALCSSWFVEFERWFRLGS